MARTVKVSESARRWFLHRIGELATVNPQAARDLIDRFRQFQENLGTFSGMGVSGDIPGTRRVVMAPYVLTIRSNRHGIEIIAIRHGRQKDARMPDEATRETDKGEV